MKKSFAERCVPYLFIAGTFLMLIVFMYFSVGLAFYTSLTDKMPGRETHFIGLENYKALLSDDMFRMSFRNQAVCRVQQRFLPATGRADSVSRPA